MSNNLVVIYHSPCMDGYGAASAFKEALDTKDWDSITYVGEGYNNVAEFPNNYSHPIRKASHVVFVDICPTREVLDFLLNDLELNVCILDHHKTAKNALTGYDPVGLFYTIADNYSGASLVKAISNYGINNLFKFDKIESAFYPEQGGILSNNDMFKQCMDRDRIKSSPIYTLLETRDLWITTDPQAKADADALAAYFKEVGQEKKDIISLKELEGLVNFLDVGHDMLREQLRIVREALEKADTWVQTVAGKDVLIALGECPNNLCSLFGGTHNDAHDMDTLAVATMSNEAGIAGLSLRSSGSLPYARLVAEALGGGGHDNASGVTLSYPGDWDRESITDEIKDILQTL